MKTLFMKRTLFAAISLLFISTSESISQATVTTVVDSSAFPFTDDLIFDTDGNLYCADYSGDAIVKRTPNGDLSIFASGFNTPNGLAFDSAGNLFMCDNIGNAIYKMDNAGTIINTFQVTSPSGMIKLESSDTLLFTTYGTQSELKKLAPDGTILDYHAGAPLSGPVGLAYAQNELYVANFSNREIYRVEDDTLIFIAQLPGSGSLGFIESIGNSLMATAFNGHEIYTVNLADNSINLYAGGILGYTDGTTDVALFTTPNGIVVNPTNDTIYISEYSSKRLRMITGFTLGTEELYNKLSVELYPNPTSNFVQIQLEQNNLPYNASITDVNGRIVYNASNISQAKLKIDISTLEQGNYTLIVKTIDNQAVRKIVKVD